VHVYRAALEFLIVRKYPNRSLEGVRGVKNFHRMTLRRYGQEALSRLDGLDLDEILENGDDFCVEDEWTKMIGDWKRVVIFYSIRLILAPLIESIILLDRLVYLKERGYTKSCVVPIFDAHISARNFLLLASKEM